MSPQLKEIEKKALELPIGERELLANHLFQSVHNQEITEIEEAWLKVSEERFQALKCGQDKGISEKSFFASIAI